MPKDSIRAVIFDLGNVLIDFDHMIAARKISGLTNKSAQEIFNLFFDSELTALFEEGKIPPLEFFSEVKKILNLEIEYRQFLPIWNEIFFLTENNREVYSLAKNLRTRYKVALLSNINILHFDYLKNNFSCFDAFCNIVTSFELGLRKPDPLIYKRTLDSLGEDPQNTFYTDDRHEFTEEASKLGIRGFVFTGPEQLRKDLLYNGVDINHA